MKELLTPLKTESLKDVFVTRFEELILSGKIAIGQKLPSERELALQLGVSRPVVHEGLMDLAAKGLVTMTPRVGSVVNDYRREGSLALLTSLVNYHDGRLEPALLESMLEMRYLFEVETARLAALLHTPDQLAEIQTVLAKEENLDPADAPTVTEVDFEFHHAVALASGNHLYPLLLNSFKQVYTNLAGRFFSDPSFAPMVFDFHKELASAIAAGDGQAAVSIMEQILTHGAERLRAMV